MLNTGTLDNGAQTLTITGNGTAGSFSVLGTYNANTGTLVLAEGGVGVTIPNQTYNNLTLVNPGQDTLAGATVVNGLLDIQAGAALANGAQMLTLQDLLVTGTLNESAGGGAITFRQAERAYGQGDYSTARNLYQEVEEGTNDYEKARAKAALCLYKLKDEEGAVREFRDYLENYVQDPRTKPVDKKKIRTRDEAMAVSTFYIGRVAYAKGEWSSVIETLQNFAEQFPGQTDYAPNALYMVVKSFLSLNDLEGAKGVVAKMRDAFGTHVRTGSGAYAIYTALQAEEAAATEAGDAAKSLALKEQMVDYVSLYNELASQPTYGILRAESSLWIDLGKFEEAEATLRKIVATFEGSNPDDITTHVLPDLGLALLEQQKVPDAYAVLDPLIPKDDSDTRRPSSQTVANWCRAVAGWLDGDADSIVEVPGVGGAGDLELACKFLLQLTASEDRNGAGKYTCPWYQLKFDTAYAYYQWGKEDSNQTKSAKTLIENLQTLTASNRLDPVAEDCGGELLQKRFLWLLDKVR